MTLPTVEAIARGAPREWDPLSVAEIDADPDAEYLREARQIAQMLAEGAGQFTIADYLASQALGERDAERDRPLPLRSLSSSGGRHKPARRLSQTV